MSKGTIICLCDITGVMSVPWVEAGYRAVLVDPQHPDTSINGPIERISATIIEAMPRLSQIIRTENVVMVIGFPPCTDVAVSGSRWFESKRAKDQHFQAKAALVAEQCRMTGLAAGCSWAFENPVACSVASSVRQITRSIRTSSLGCARMITTRNRPASGQVTASRRRQRICIRWWKRLSTP